MVNSQRKTLVTGATGQQGGSLARLLLQKNIKYTLYWIDRKKLLSMFTVAIIYIIR